MSDPVLDLAREMLRVCDGDRTAMANPTNSSAIVRYDTLRDVCIALIARTEALWELMDAEIACDWLDNLAGMPQERMLRRDLAWQAARAALGDGAAEREENDERIRREGGPASATRENA